MRPNSLRQVPTETWWPSLKRAKTCCKIGYPGRSQTGLHLNGMQTTPRNTVRWDGRSTLFLAFILRPREWMWPRTISLWRLTSSWSEPEWANHPDSSVHECPWSLKGASAASMHFVNVLGAKASRRAGPCIGKPSLQRQTEGTSCVFWTTLDVKIRIL